jgi:putative ABC transport system ATP-binding protein
MIRFENVSLSFDEHKVLDNFSLEISKGDKVVFTGRSGIGKTSLFRLLLGFTKPDSGKIYFMDKLMDHRQVWNFRRLTAYVSQDLCIGHNTVREFFDTILSFKSNCGIELLPRAKELISYFELDNATLDKQIADLSGGEKQRIAIVQAVLLNKNIYLLDEITSALDEKLKIKAIDYFFSRKEWTVLCISHDNIFTENSQTRFINMETDK